jgi:geranylgeranyl diphosphate synthase type I
MLKLKTGVLFQFAAETGAMLAFEEEDYQESRIKSIGEFAVNAGIAFQMQDDILGVFADESVLGKPICSDFSEAKPTLLFYKTMELLDSVAGEEFKSFMGKKNLTSKDINRIRELIVLSGADKIILSEAKKIVDKSKEILATLPYNKYNELLVKWVDYLVGRSL